MKTAIQRSSLFPSYAGITAATGLPMTPQTFTEIKVTQADINLWEWCKTALRESRNWSEDDPATNEHLFRLDTQAQKLLAAHRVGR